MTTAATVNRVAGRIDVMGKVDTSTFFTMGNSGNNVRSAATTNGTEFWIAGAGGGTAGGVWYNTLGAAGTETRVVSTPNNVRWLAIFGNQLYASSNTDPYSSVFAIGFGTPTAMGQTATVVDGPPSSGGSPYGFALFNLNGGSDPDLLYLATNASGLQKWAFNGTDWDLTTLNIPNNAGFRGVAAYAAGGKITLMASTAETPPNRLAVFVDDRVNTPTGSAVFTAPTNTAFRGVAVSPNFAAP
jgi:hypothetical protein